MKIPKFVKVFIIFLLLFVVPYGMYFLYRLDKPKMIKALPDPFVFNNGTYVETETDWSARREEIKQLLLDEEYGHMPGRPDAIEAELTDLKERDDDSILAQVNLSIIPFNDSDTKIELPVDLYIPKGEGPFPTLVKVSPDGTGNQVEINTLIVERGYIFVCFHHTELDPDTKGYDMKGPCQKTYSNYSWGSLAVWAWGAMRVADFLLQEPWSVRLNEIPEIRPDALIITGHSRRGKTALLAGAMDERFSMVVPNDSGCGGAGSFLIQGHFSETIADITSKARFKSWFHQDFGDYAGKEYKLSFDQHFLRALVAPRLMLSTEAFWDVWSNPTGTQAIFEACIPVFAFLGVKENNAIHYRMWGGHAYTDADFKVVLDFSDKMLLNKDVSGDFYMTPFDIDFPIPYGIPNQ
ncbi:MAG: hypothetical protein R6U96_02620 [Promethearchaeia archaeon]